MVDIFAALFSAIAVGFVALAVLAGLFGLVLIIGIVLSAALAAVRGFVDH